VNDILPCYSAPQNGRLILSFADGDSGQLARNGKKPAIYHSKICFLWFLHKKNVDFTLISFVY
jgi:hypothetical protein